MKKPNKFKYKRVRLYWQDIVSNPEWLHLLKQKIRCIHGVKTQVIYYTRTKKKVIIFASHSFDDDGELTMGNTTTYPRSVVQKNRSIKMEDDKIFEEIGCLMLLKIMAA